MLTSTSFTGVRSTHRPINARASAAETALLLENEGRIVLWGDAVGWLL